MDSSVKYIVMLSVLLASVAYAAPKGFVDPVNFDGSDNMKKNVIAYIKQQTANDAGAIGLNSPTMLRMMERQEMNSFKNLIAKKLDAEIWQQVLDNYCNVIIVTCGYQMLEMMYSQELQAVKTTLDW